MRRRQGLCVLSWCRGIYRGGVTGSLFLAQQLNGDNFPAWGRSRLLKVHPCSGGPVLRRHDNWPTVEPNCPVREAVHYAGLSIRQLQRAQRLVFRSLCRRIPGTGHARFLNTDHRLADRAAKVGLLCSVCRLVPSFGPFIRFLTVQTWRLFSVRESQVTILQRRPFPVLCRIHGPTIPHPLALMG